MQPDHDRLLAENINNSEMAWVAHYFKEVILAADTSHD